MSRVVFTTRAREDLLDIWLYVAAYKSEAVADRILDRIEQSCRLLADHPQLGRARPEIQPNTLARRRALACPLRDGRRADRAHH